MSKRRTSSQIRQQLLARIHRRYQVVRERIALGPMELNFTRVADPNLVLDQVATEADRLEKLRGSALPDEQLHLPYWAELWDSSRAVAAFLAGQLKSGSYTPPLAGLRVMDLGCGMGLAGAMAARLGANGLFADLETPPLLFARLNSLADGRRVRLRRLNWQTDFLSRRFDLILGADILYDKSQWPHLERFWLHHLAEGATVLLGEPGRQTGTLFLQWIEDKPWRVELISQPLAGRESPVRLVQITKAEGW